MTVSILNSAYAQQLTVEGKKREWVVYDKDINKLWTFPKEWNEKAVMSAIKLGREYETKAFNRGVEYQKSMNPDTIRNLQELVRRYSDEREGMIKRNEMLSNELDRLNKQLDTITVNSK